MTALRVFVGIVLCGLVALAVFGAEATWQTRGGYRDHRDWWK